MTNSPPESDSPNASERIIELRLPSRLGYEKVAMDAAASLARRMGFNADRIDALRTALAEAVTNAIEHGNEQDAAMKVLVMLTVKSDELIVSVADQGRKQLDQEKTVITPKIEDSFTRTDKGGWGIWLIRNQVRMVIHLEK